MSRIPLEKTVFDKDAFDKVVNRQFTQLSPAANLNAQGEVPAFTLEDFLALFDSLYDFIPNDVLRAMLERIAATLGIRIDDTDIQALLEEITALRQQLIEIQLTVNSIPKEGF